MTFRQRLIVYAMDLDLTVELFGEKKFAPILVGPVGNQQALHPEGELDTVRGAGAAKTTTIISSHSSYPIDQIAAAATGAIWYQVYADDERTVLDEQVARALSHGWGFFSRDIVWTARWSPPVGRGHRLGRG